jgi:hypothetical protein
MLVPDRLSCFWPGLAWAWWHGSARGLLAAIGFGWTLTLLLLATFVWPGWFAPRWVGLLWLSLLVYWLVEIVRGQWTWTQLRRHGLPQPNDDRFTAAQREYLRGNWFEAESLLQEILHDAPRDAEAQLLLAGVLRHCRRWNAAARRLDFLEALDTASIWRFEIARERQHLQRLREESLAGVEKPSAAPGTGEVTADVAIERLVSE